MNPTDEARLDWDEDGPDESDVLADNETLATENARLNAEVDRLNRLVVSLRADLNEEAGYGQQLQQQALRAREDADRAWDARNDGGSW